MNAQASIRIVEVSPLTDPSRHGRWLTIELWDQEVPTRPLLLGAISMRLGDHDTVIARSDLERVAAHQVERFVRFLANGVEEPIIEQGPFEGERLG